MNDRLIRFLALFLCVTSVLAFLPLSGGVTAAAEDWEPVDLGLNCDLSLSSVEAYLYKGEYYIPLDTLAVATRCTVTRTEDTVRMEQGQFGGVFDLSRSTFFNGTNTEAITLLSLPNDRYAVAALPFLRYFHAVEPFISEGTLYFRMPVVTPWEALDVDIDGTFLDINDLYGGKKNVKIALACDVLADIALGEGVTDAGYINDAYMQALALDPLNYGSVQAFAADASEAVEVGVLSQKGLDFLEAVEKLTTDIAAPVHGLYIADKYAKEITDQLLAAMWLTTDTEKSMALDLIDKIKGEGYLEYTDSKKFFNSAEKYLLVATAALETSRDMACIKHTGNLAYRVMGQENLKDLDVPQSNNKWFQIADMYQDVYSDAVVHVYDNLLDYLEDKAFDKLLETAFEKAASGFGAGFIGLCVSLSQAATKHLFLSSTVEGLQADRRAICLSKLQDQVYWVLKAVHDKLLTDGQNASLYERYVAALQMYCRVSLAMYDNLYTATKNLDVRNVNLMDFCQKNIDKLALSLYKLTFVQGEEGAQSCVPGSVATPQTDPQASAVKDYYKEYLPCVQEEAAGIFYRSAVGSCFFCDLDGDGTDELLLLNHYPGSITFNPNPYYAFSVYDWENGAVQKKADRILLYYEAGAPSGWVGVTETASGPKIVYYNRNGDDQLQGEAYTLFTLKNYDFAHYAERSYDPNDPEHNNACALNRNQCSYEEYLAAVEKVQPLIAAETEFNDPSDGSKTVYDMLILLQKAAGIKASRTPAITEEAAEAIAREQWSFYLSSDYGFDWRIARRDSLVKDGVEYYSFALTHNAAYGENVWFVSLYLFVNSLTGEFSPNLF